MVQHPDLHAVQLVGIVEDADDDTVYCPSSKPRRRCHDQSYDFTSRPQTDARNRRCGPIPWASTSRANGRSLPMPNIIVEFLRDLVRSRRDLVIENLALRQQILVLQRSNPRPPFTPQDRTFWVLLCRYWAGWRRPLRLVQPETVIAWHRKSWRLGWKRKSRPQAVGRPRIPFDVVELIRRVSRENPTWGAPRIHGELLKLGYFVSEATVARYMVKRRGRPTQNWRTFLDNHLRETCAIDFLTVPTVMFKTIYVFVVLSLDRRRIPPQRHCPSDRRMDRAPDHPGIPLRRCTAIPHSRPRSDIQWRGRIRATHHGHQGEGDQRAFPKAERLLRVRDRHTQARMPEPRHCLQRSPRATPAQTIPRVLPWLTNPSRPRQGHA